MYLKNVILSLTLWGLLLPTDAVSKLITITGDQLNVRSGPGRRYDIVEIVNTDEKFEIIEENNGWYQISVEGTIGWIPEKATRSIAADDIQRLLEQADDYFYRQQFTTPPEANAHDIYRQVLQQEPENPHALKKIQQMAKTYKTWADAAYEKDEEQKARVFYQRYLFLVPGDRDVEDLLRKIETPGLPSEASLRITRLRNEPMALARQDIVQMIQKHRFHHPADWSKYDLSPSITGDFQHEYVLKDFQGVQVIIDYATRLMWQQTGPDKPMTWQNAYRYIEQLNTEGYAGFSNWRLPTIEELASLLEERKTQEDLFLDAIFGPIPLWCWSADKAPTTKTAWYISFNSGGIQQHTTENTAFVLAVRSYE